MIQRLTNNCAYRIQPYVEEAVDEFYNLGRKSVLVGELANHRENTILHS